MPYTAEINRSQPTAFVFLIDQSGSMSDKMPSGETKADFLAKVLNKTIYQLIIRSTKADGVRPYFDLAVFAYGGSGITSGFGGALAHSMIHPLPTVEQNPLRNRHDNEEGQRRCGWSRGAEHQVPRLVRSTQQWWNAHVRGPQKSGRYPCWLVQHPRAVISADHHSCDRWWVG